VGGGAFVGEQRNDLAGQLAAALCVVCVAGSVGGVNDLHRSHVGFHKNPSFCIGGAGKSPEIVEINRVAVSNSGVKRAALQVVHSGLAGKQAGNALGKQAGHIVGVFSACGISGFDDLIGFHKEYSLFL